MYSRILGAFASATLALPSRAWVNPSIGARAIHRSTALMMSTDELKTGTVKWFNVRKGFGFIVPTDGSSDVFVHQTAIIADGFRSLADGEDVEFKVIQDDSGRLKAVDVTGPEGNSVKGAPFGGGNGDQGMPYGDGSEERY